MRLRRLKPLRTPPRIIGLGAIQGLYPMPLHGPPRRRKKRASMPRGASCRRVGKLTAAKKKRLPSTAFGLPESRRYPMPDPQHAANAKGRAKAQLSRGTLSRADYNRIVRKANRILRACGGLK